MHWNATYQKQNVFKLLTKMPVHTSVVKYTTAYSPTTAYIISYSVVRLQPMQLPQNSLLFSLLTASHFDIIHQTFGIYGACQQLAIPSTWYILSQYGHSIWAHCYNSCASSQPLNARTMDTTTVKLQNADTVSNTQHLLGVSLSKPHTSELNHRFFVYLSYVILYVF